MQLQNQRELLSIVHAKSPELRGPIVYKLMPTVLGIP